MSIYNWFDSNSLPLGVEILPCGGRATLLSLFEKRNQFAEKTVIFLVDQDLWLFSGVPSKFKGLVLTDGYSIENDVLASSAVNRLFTSPERKVFYKITHEIATWFASEVHEHLLGHIPILDVHVNRLIPLKSVTLSPDYMSNRGYHSSLPSILLRRIQADPKKMVRGKNILQLYVRILSARKRYPKHSTGSILEIATKIRPSQQLKNLKKTLLKKIKLGDKKRCAGIG